MLPGEPPISSNATAPHHGGAQCVIRLLGGEVNTASFAMYTFSISVLFQALLVRTLKVETFGETTTV